MTEATTLLRHWRHTGKYRRALATLYRDVNAPDRAEMVKECIKENLTPELAENAEGLQRIKGLGEQTAYEVLLAVAVAAMEVEND